MPRHMKRASFGAGKEIAERRARDPEGASLDPPAIGGLKRAAQMRFGHGAQTRDAMSREHEAGFRVLRAIGPCPLQKIDQLKGGAARRQRAVYCKLPAGDGARHRSRQGLVQEGAGGVLFGEVQSEACRHGVSPAL